MTYRFGPSGGLGGQDFETPPTSAPELKGIRVLHGNLIDAVGLIWSTDEEPQMVGGPEGQVSTLELEPGETLTRLAGRHGAHIDSLTFTTSRGREVTFGGDGGLHTFEFTVPAGHQLRGLFGRAGHYLDALGVVLDAGTAAEAAVSTRRAPRQKKPADEVAAPAPAKRKAAAKTPVVAAGEAEAAPKRPRKKAVKEQPGGSE